MLKMSRLMSGCSCFAGATLRFMMSSVLFIYIPFFSDNFLKGCWIRDLVVGSLCQDSPVKTLRCVNLELDSWYNRPLCVDISIPTFSAGVGYCLVEFEIFCNVLLRDILFFHFLLLVESWILYKAELRQFHWYHTLIDLFSEWLFDWSPCWRLAVRYCLVKSWRSIIGCAFSMRIHWDEILTWVRFVSISNTA